jgi:hypothetical protein
LIAVVVPALTKPWERHIKIDGANANYSTIDYIEQMSTTKAGVSGTIEERHKYDNQALQLQQLQAANSKIKKGMKIKLDCEFCHGPILGDPHVFKFATYERFFCCTACTSGYKKKNVGRIDSIRRKFEEKITASVEF